MPTYSFEAKIPGGKTIKGQVNAPTEVEARVKLRAQKLIPVRIFIKGQKDNSNKQAGKVKGKELQAFTRQFATLINSGIPVVQGLEILSDGIANPNLKLALDKTKAQISQGRKLADAMSDHPKVFDKLFVNLVKAGEEGGVLDTILERLAIYIEKAEKIKNKVKGAMFYPISIVVVAALVVTAILYFVIPQFESLFAEAGQELPELTQMVIAISHFLRDYWYILFGSIFAALFVLRQYYATVSGKYNIDFFLIKSPIIGNVIQKSEIARFSRTLSTLLASGVALLNSLEISANAVGNAVIEKTLKECKGVIAEGKSIVTPLAKNPYIPDMVVQMIGVGEQTGALDIMLEKIADFYEEEVDYAVSSATTLIEPIMMVVLGGIIAFIVVAMYLPVFNLAGTM